MKKIGATPLSRTDILIIGSGVAGLSAAIEAAKYGKVLLITKDTLTECNTEQAQGGVAVVLSEGDSFEKHIKDTLEMGNGLCNEEAVRILVEEGPSRIQDLIQWGANFDKDEDGKLSFTQESGHTLRRIIHAKGDGTGAEIEMTLIRKIRENSNIEILEYTFAIELAHKDGVCFGAIVDVRNVGIKIIHARATILATGGIGQIYRETTNSVISTGCGIALAYRAGAYLLDMEFVQFHPTTLYIAGATRSLISETVRGEGAILKNRYGERFMAKYHPAEELASRDIVSRAILKEIKETDYTHVYLDLTHMDPLFLAARFPSIMKTCASFGIDIREDFIPVRPTAHYMIGGVKINLKGETDIKNLYACGETASSGLHGANRLASNSLLEGLVFGWRAGYFAGKDIKNKADFRPVKNIASNLDYSCSKDLDVNDIKNSLKSVMSRCVGIVRDEKGLLEAKEKIDFWSSYVMNAGFTDSRGWELQSMLTIAKLIQEAAFIRQESRGVHYRKDYPAQKAGGWLKARIELSKDRDYRIIKI